MANKDLGQAIDPTASDVVQLIVTYSGGEVQTVRATGKIMFTAPVFGQDSVPLDAIRDRAALPPGIRAQFEDLLPALAAEIATQNEFPP